MPRIVLRVLAATLVVVAIGARLWLRAHATEARERNLADFSAPDGRAGSPLGRDDPSRCAGEPTRPVASVLVPGDGELREVAAACGGGAISVVVHRGDGLYYLSRGSSAGMAWDEPDPSDRLADDAALLTQAAPLPVGMSFVAWLSKDHQTLSFTALGPSPDVQHYPLVQPIDATRLYALGGTNDHLYLLTQPGAGSAAHATVVRVDRDAPDSDGPPGAGVARFDLGPGAALAVQPGEGHARVLWLDASGALVRTRGLDLSVLDNALSTAPGAAAAVAPAASLSVLPGEIHVDGAQPFAAPLGDGAPSAFLLGAGQLLHGAGDRCDGASIGDLCAAPGAVRLALFADASPASAGEPLVTQGRPLAVWSRFGRYEALMSQGDHALVRYAFDEHGRAVEHGPLVGPGDLSRLMDFHYTDCGGASPWMIFVSKPGSTPLVSALPAECTHTDHPAN